LACEETIARFDVTTDLNETFCRTTKSFFCLRAAKIPGTSPNYLSCVEFLTNKLHAIQINFIIIPCFQDIRGTSRRSIASATPVRCKIFATIIIIIQSMLNFTPVLSYEFVGVILGAPCNTVGPFQRSWTEIIFWESIIECLTTSIVFIKPLLLDIVCRAGRSSSNCLGCW